VQINRFHILKYIILFAVVYLALMFIGGYIIRELEVAPPSMSNMVVIVVSVLLVNAIFLRREKRRPSWLEYTGLVLGATFIDLALEIYTLSYSSGPILWGTLTLITLSHTLLFAVGFFPRGKKSTSPVAT
jgi:hypothetical protein